LRLAPAWAMRVIVDASAWSSALFPFWGAQSSGKVVARD